MSANQDSASRKFDTVGYLVAGVVFLIACCTCWVAIVHSTELSTALKGAVHDTARQVGLAQDTEPVKPAVKPVEKPVKLRSRAMPEVKETPAAPETHPPIEAEAVVQNQRVAMQSHDKNIIVVKTH
jgi:hypothetical protein